MARRNQDGRSQSASPDSLLRGDNSVFDLNSGQRIQLVKPSYHSVLSDETLFDLGILNGNQAIPQTGLAMNLSYMSSQQFMMQQAKEDSLELEDYVQGLNDRFDLPSDQILPMTPRCSFDQGISYIAYANVKQIHPYARIIL
jgi:hypothetical protein